MKNLLPTKHYPKQFLLNKLNLFQKKHLKVTIGLCVHREISAETFYALQSILACPDPIFSVSMERGDALIERSRSILASRFLKSDDDILLFVDDDIFFYPQDAIKICKEAVELGIVGGCYVTKSEIQPTLQQKIYKGQEIILNPDSKPVEVRSVSTGFMAIHRRIFEKMKENEQEFPLCYPQQFYPFFKTGYREVDGLMRFLGEDWNFCANAKDLGFNSYLDPSIRLIHFGRYAYTVDDINRLKRVDGQILRYKEQFNEFPLVSQSSEASNDKRLSKEGGNPDGASCSYSAYPTS